MKLSKMFVVLIIALIIPSVVAHGNETIERAQQIIDEGIPCADLSEDDIAILGDYAMEQMHPGEAHEVMDEMMGGEGSESLRDAHIRMGLSFYCVEDTSESRFGYGGMMGSGPDMIDPSYRAPWVGFAGWFVGIALLVLVGVAGYLFGRR